jgi:hypothetical protein
MGSHEGNQRIKVRGRLMNECEPRVQQRQSNHSLTQNAFHLVQNHVDAPDEEYDMLWQQCRLVALSIPVVRRAPLTVGGHVLLGVLNGLFQRDGEGKGDAGELDGQTGAACDVEVGKLTEGVLEFEDANQFGVQSEDAGTTSL